MIQSGTPCPYNGKIGNEALKEWQKYDKLRPDYEQYTADLKYIEKKNKKLEKAYEKKMKENAEELSKQQVELDAVAAEKQKLIDEMNELKGVNKKVKEKNITVHADNGPR
jgi:alpha-L-arabinofuranosidase